MRTLVHRCAVGASNSLATLAVVAALVVASPAVASHYFLVDIGEQFTPIQLSEFQRFGFQTTEDLLRNVDTPDARAAIASSTGIPETELLEVARMCDFLQIDGVGPRAYRLLRASGVATVADLAARDAASLHAEIVTVNAVERITGVDPDVELVGQWILAAAEVPIRVDY